MLPEEETFREDYGSTGSVCRECRQFFNSSYDLFKEHGCKEIAAIKKSLGLIRS